MRRWRAVASVAAAFAVLLCLTLTEVAGATPRAASLPARRMLVVSLPAVTWADLPLARMANLRGLLAQSMVADLSVRGANGHPNLADGYLTISAGARALGSPHDGDAIVRSDGSIVVPSFPQIVAHNRELLFDAHPGLLGTTLQRAGIDRAVIGNADRSSTVAGSGRRVATALATPDGVTPRGNVNTDLLATRPDRPFDVGIDSSAYLSAFHRVWSGRTVVLAEDSDLVRFDGLRLTDARERATRLDVLLVSFDHLLGEMLASVDTTRDAVMVVGPTYPHGAAQLTLAAFRAPGTKPGLAVSDYTRRAGFVSIVDIGPTILDAFGVKAPNAMEGRALQLGRTGGNFGDRVSFLVDANRASVFRDVHVQAVTTAFLVAQLVLVVAAVIGFSFRNRAVRRAVELIALSLLGGLPAMFLAGLFSFDQHRTALYWAFLAGAGIVIGAGAYLVADRHGTSPLIICLAIIVGVLVVDVVTGAHLQFNTAFGYSPTVGGRFAGIGNLAYSELAAAALLLAALVVYRVGAPAGARWAATLLVLAVVVDGAPMWGSDIGGVLSMVPAYGIAVTGLLGLRVRLRSVLIALGATALAIGAAIAIDLSRPKDRQTHLGRLVTSTRDGGWHSFSVVVERKFLASIATVGVSQWAIIAPIVLAFLVYIVVSAPEGFSGLVERIPSLRPALTALTVLAVLGFALNDSGIRIPAVMLGIVTPVIIVIRLRSEHDQVHV